MGFFIYIWVMDYRNNIDHRDCQKSCGPSYNQVLDVVFDEGSTSPTEPVTLTEAKLFCKIDIDDDDATITALITAARQMCEGYCNVGFINRTVTAVMNNGNGYAYLPYGPVGDVDTINTIAPVDGEITGVQFKQLVTRGERMTIVYNGGYEILPGNLKTALLNAIYFLYDNRSQGTDNIGPIAQMLLKPLRRVW